MLSHLPATLAIAAAGAGMVSLIEHAPVARTPAATAWLLSGSVAGTLLAVVLISRSLEDWDHLPSVYRTVSRALAAGALLAVAVGWWAPAPWLLAIVLVAVPLVIWLVALRAYLVATQDAGNPAGS